MIMSTGSDCFISSFPNCMPSFSYLIALARTSSTLLNKSNEGRHICLVLNLRRKEFSFSLLFMMSFVVFL